MNLPNNDNPDKDGTFINMEVASGTYQFKFQYSKTKNIPYNDFVTSPIFKVNGHEFKILYFPPGSERIIRITLAMHYKSEKVPVTFTFGLLDKNGRPSSKACTGVITHTFDHFLDECDFPDFMKRSELEADFIRDGCFTLVCSITIFNEFYKEVPKRFVHGIMPFSIDEHFVQLLDRKETADVRFEVEGEIFTAHRLVLAARSPVFNAGLFGMMAERKTEIISIKDIKPAVFNAMLHFIYTDSLPDMSNENTPHVTMIQHLLVAADRYALDGLKMLCEDSLTRDISIDSALSTLTLAEELDLQELREMCVSFVCDRKNLVMLSVTNDYVQLMVHYPSLLEVISYWVRG
ncbi:BTB/POZ and MATH domain-containing protein 1-like [Carex rostrata]